MTITKIEIKPTSDDNSVPFVVWDWGFDDWNEKDRPYAFVWHNEEVIFMFGGGKGTPRIIDHAKTLEEATRIAAHYISPSSDKSYFDRTVSQNTNTE
jgi:hypothetical protein